MIPVPVINLIQTGGIVTGTIPIAGYVNILAVNSVAGRCIFQTGLDVQKAGGFKPGFKTNSVFKLRYLMLNTVVQNLALNNSIHAIGSEFVFFQQPVTNTGGKRNTGIKPTALFYLCGIVAKGNSNQQSDKSQSCEFFGNGVFYHSLKIRKASKEKSGVRTKKNGVLEEKNKGCVKKNSV